MECDRSGAPWINIYYIFSTIYLLLTISEESLFFSYFKSADVCTLRRLFVEQKLMFGCSFKCDQMLNNHTINFVAH
jgi:hypothetical protein